MILTYKDFFNFDDPGSVNEIITFIDKLTQSYTNLSSATKKNLQGTTDAMEANRKAAEDYLISLEKVNYTQEKGQKEVADMSKVVNTLINDQVKLTQTEKSYLKSISESEKHVEKLTKAKNDLKKVVVNESGSINDLKQKLNEAIKVYNALGDSTDKAIKDEHLKNVKELSTQYNTVNKAVNEAKKVTQAAAGSYNELNARVLEAKKELKGLEGGMQGGSKRAEELRKFIKGSTDQLKEFDNSIGDNQRKVGDYAGELASLIPGFSGVSKAANVANKSLWAIVANPIGLIIAAIGAAIGSLVAYFKSSQEAEDEFNKITAVAGVILDNLMDIVEGVGKALWAAISEPKKLWEDFKELISPLTTELTKAWDDPIQAIKDFGQAILDNVINRIKSVGVYANAIGDIFSGDVVKGLKGIGNATIQATTGIENGLDKVANAAANVWNAASGAFDDFIKKNQEEIIERLKIAGLEAKFRKETIADIIDDAETELKAAQLLAKVKDDLRVTDEERLKSLREANQLLEDQVRGDVELAKLELEIEERKAALNENTFEDNKRIAELRAKVMETETAFFTAQKRRLTEERSLVLEIQKRKEEAQKAEMEAEERINEFRVKQNIEANEEILSNEFTTLEQRLAAVNQINESEIELIESKHEQELELAKKAAIQRVQLSDEELKEIFDNRALSIEEQLALEQQFRERKLATDQAYLNEALRIESERLAEIDKITEQSAERAKENVFAVLNRDAEIFSARFEASVNDQLRSLNEAFNSGELKSLEEFEREKSLIMKRAQEENLKAQLEYLRKQIQYVDEGSQKQYEIEKQISELELQLSDETAKQKLDFEKRLRSEVENLRLQAADFVQSMFNAQREQEVAKLEEQLAIEQEHKNQRLAIVQDDAQARAFIEADFAEKQKQIQDDIAKEKRRAAIFEKARSASETIINTAKGVATAVAESPLTFGLPWSAFVAITGGLQLAKILSTPIPQYFKGTQFSAEGFAEVGERGRELIVTPSGDVQIAELPQVQYLQRGSKVYTHEKTEDIIKKAFNGNDDDSSNSRQSIQGVSNEAIISAISESGTHVVQAIKSQPQDEYDEYGYRRYERTINGRVRRLNKRYQLS